MSCVSSHLCFCDLRASAGRIKGVSEACQYGVGVVTVLDLRGTVQLIKGCAGGGAIGMHDAGLVAVLIVGVACQAIVVVRGRYHSV